MKYWRQDWKEFFWLQMSRHVVLDCLCTVTQSCISCHQFKRLHQIRETKSANQLFRILNARQNWTPRPHEVTGKKVFKEGACNSAYSILHSSSGVIASQL